jgi:hypothetical protein
MAKLSSVADAPPVSDVDVLVFVLSDVSVFVTAFV